MAVLRISESSYSTSELARINSHPLTLSELFLRGPGGSCARALLARSNSDAASVSVILNPLISVAAQMLWPKCAVPTFQEFLLSACQHLQIQVIITNILKI